MNLKYTGKMYPFEDKIYKDTGEVASPSAPVYPENIGNGSVTTLEHKEAVTPAPGYVYTPGSAAPTDGDPLSYAGWLQGSTKYQAEQDRIRAEKAAETDRQKQILDANNAYRTGLATYGANAERMASMGLTNSGYGEYLTGKAYATQRGEVQNANRTAQARIDQALYEEGKIKQQADAKYAEDLLGIRNQQNVDYGSLYDSALNGASIESIMQDSRWGTLTPEQRTTIKTVTTQNSIKIRIDNGESLETIIADPASGWNDLTVDQQNTLNTYSTSKTEAKNAEIASNFDSFLTAINNGSATLADIQALPGWQDMVGTVYETQLQAAWDKREKGNKFNELLRNVQNGDLTAETLQQHADWALMDETQRDQLLDAAKAHSDKKVEDLKEDASVGQDFTTIVNDPNYGGASDPDQNLIKNTFVNSFVEQSNYGSKEEFTNAIKNAGITDQTDIVAAIEKWQEREYKAMLRGSALLSGEEIYSAYESGIISFDQMNSYIKEKYGDKTAFKPNGTLSGMGAARNTDQVTITLADGSKSRWNVNKLPKGVTSDELDAFYGGTPEKTSRGEAHWVVYKGNIYISGKAGWKILEPFEPILDLWDEDAIITALAS